MKTESEIENILRQAPTPKPAPQLAEALKSAVKLPSQTNGNALELGVPLWRRWFPALAYAVLILGCVVVLAVQSNQQQELIRQNEQLRAEIAVAEEAADAREQEQAQSQSAAREIGQLKRDAAEADRLTERLAGLLAQIDALTAQAKDLNAQLAAVPENQKVIAPYDFFDAATSPLKEARERAAAISCVNNMKQIGLAIRIWENDHNDMFPPNLNSVSNELNTVKVLCCPSDTALQKVAQQLAALPDRGWSRWPLNGGSYDVFLSPEVNSTKPTAIITRCRFHGHEGFADGSVQWGKKEGALKP